METIDSAGKKIRVMIVEDSPVVRELLRHLIGQDPRLEVVAAVASAEEALQRLHEISPDVVSMDIRLPGMNGLEATQRIMRDKPTPIVVVAGSVAGDELRISSNALRIGALSVVEKPVGVTHRDYQTMAERLCTQLAVMSQVKVIRQRLHKTARVEAARSSELPRDWGDRSRPFEMLGIVASTGGPVALQKLLGGLGPSFPLPIALVQHMADAFLDSFADWLESTSPLPVKIAQAGETPLAGMVYVAPAERHLTLQRGRWHLSADEPVSSQRPSGTVLFRSLAQNLGAGAIGVLLTGMGEDGAAGLKSLHDAGSYTIAEDKSTAVVYGMPAVAVRLGAVCESLPLDKIACRLEQLVSISKEVRR
ncbi:MAG TPA: chemotaxis-specific protein-glutamate methyltransferase CheB [Pirellulales bacterium]|jgi:two-component system chemotaxis response regulator CheB|nr:chemotaxis-specific protein-glutamate methyltransferase CheB [Pirellulales bacterium]